jgi:hypothetical protein
MNAMPMPMIESPMTSAIGPIAASGATYPVKMPANELVSVAMTGHSDCGRRVTLVARSTRPMTSSNQQLR